MQYIWEYRLWNPSSMTTNDGRRVRIIDPGLRNTDAGPDFFNAKIEIDGYVWAGNVEIHYRASDWKRHGHDRDRAYDSVVLHVVDKDDAPVYRSNGERIPQMVMKCSPRFSERYAELVNSKVELPCKAVIQAMEGLEMAEWVQSLAFERLQEKGRRVKDLLERYHGSWEDVCYVTLARNIGFGTNNDAFERLAKSLPLTLLHKHAEPLRRQILRTIAARVRLSAHEIHAPPSRRAGVEVVPHASAEFSVAARGAARPLCAQRFPPVFRHS